MLDSGNGTKVLDLSTKFVGTGHCSEIITDDNGTDWIMYHAIPLNEKTYAGNWYRALMLDKITWGSDGWPMIGNNGQPTGTEQSGPVFK